MRRLMLALVLGVIGCNSGDSFGVPTALVSGQWTMTLTNFTGSGFTCNASGITLQLAQAGTTFSGTFSGGTISCTTPNGPLQATAPSGQIINGVISGTAVQFDLGNADSRFVGGLTGGGEMSGNGTESTTFNGTVVSLSGTWSATKNP